MNIISAFGKIEAKIDGFDSGLMVNRLRKECNVILLYVKNDSVYITVPYTNRRVLEKVCEEHGFSLTIIREKGLYYKLSKYKKRYGILMGIIICIVTVLYLSNCALKIRVVGAESDILENKIKLILAEDGIKAGGYIPSMNFLEANARLVKLCDEVSWASIGNSGSVVTVNISQSTLRVPTDLGRIPCNITASRDGLLVSADVLSGELCVLIGDTVKKGDILVNGVIERRNGVTYYYHSMARMMALFDETIEFEQSIYDRATIDGETVYTNSLCFFDLELMNPFSKTPKANCKISSYRTPIRLFGIELPISVSTTKYTEQISKLKIYTHQEAEDIIRGKLKTYEDNLLAGYEIVNSEVIVDTVDDVVKLTAKYTLKGDIAQESPIYIKEITD